MTELDKFTRPSFDDLVNGAKEKEHAAVIEQQQFAASAFNGVLDYTFKNPKMAAVVLAKITATCEAVVSNPVTADGQLLPEGVTPEMARRVLMYAAENNGGEQMFLRRRSDPKSPGYIELDDDGMPTELKRLRAEVKLLQDTRDAALKDVDDLRDAMSKIKASTTPGVIEMQRSDYVDAGDLLDSLEATLEKIKPSGA